MAASRPSRSAGLARPRGPLPARVYWTRRIALLGTALLLVVGLARVLGAGSDGADTAADRAAPASAGTAADPTGPTIGPTPTTGGPSADARPGKRRGAAREKRPEPSPEPPPAVPTGPCADEDVRVEPQVPEAVGGGPITVVLELRTVEAEACWWAVSSESLTMRITSGDDEIWTSRQCPRAVPRRAVAVRRDGGTAVPVSWSGRRSDEECSRLTEWALPGWYHVEAAALAGEPADLQFQVTAPQPEVVTRTVRPERPRARGGQGEGRSRGGQRQDGAAQDGAAQDGTGQDGTGQDAEGR